MGKSALALRFLAESGQAARGIYLDIRDLVPAGELSRDGAVAHRLAVGIAEELVSERLAHVDVGTVSAASLVQEVLPQVCGADKPRLVIVLDEFDLLQGAGLRRAWRGFFRGRHLPRPPMYVAMVGASWSDAAASIGFDPEGNRSRAISLQPLTLEEVGALMRQFAVRGLFEVEPEAIAAVWNETSGYPLFCSALLDDVYERRWEARDRSPLHETEVRDAARRCELRMPTRVRHALRQSGPMAVQLLRMLARDNGRSDRELEQLLIGGRGAERQELRRVLDGLRASGLVSRSGPVVICSPLLEGWVREMPAADAERVDHTPNPDAYTAYRAAEARLDEGERDQAITLLEEAARLDAEYWQPRWLLARQLLDRARDNDNTRRKDAEHAVDLLARVREEAPQSNRTGDEIAAAYCQALVLFAATFTPKNQERRRTLEKLRREDGALATPGAAELVAADDVARWSDLLRGAPQGWEQHTRELMRHDRNVQPAAEQLAAQVTEAIAVEDPERVARLLATIVPLVIAVEPYGGLATSFWDAVSDGVRFILRVRQPAGQLGVAFWEAVLLAWPAPKRDTFLAMCAPALQAWCRESLAGGDGRAAETVARTLQELDRTAEVRATFTDAELQVLDSVGDRTRTSKLAGALGRYLMALWTEGRTSAIDLTEVVALARDFCAEALAELPPHVDLPQMEFDAWWELARTARETGRRRGGTGEADVAPIEAFVARLRKTVPNAEAEPLSARERESVNQLLGDLYTVEERLAVRIPGLSAQTVNETVGAYRARKRGEEGSFLVRIFRLRAGRPEVTRLLRRIWENEQRALSIISLRPDGHALTRFEDALFLGESEAAVIVTEWPGSLTLRERLGGARKGLFDPSARWRLWQHLVPMLEGIGALHSERFIHRGLRPEVVFVNEEATEDLSTPALKLAQFEWSVYLRGLWGFASPIARDLDRYLAPEALRAALGIDDRGPCGESFASDLYSVGLLLFECVVRPFNEYELGFYRSADAYSAAEEMAHQEWLDRLCDETLKAPLSAVERNLLLKLLKFDFRDRPTSIDHVITLARSAAHPELQRVTALRSPLKALATLSSEQPDPRQDHECIAFYIRRQLPQVQVASIEEVKNELKRMIDRELTGESVEVYLNRHASEFPLLIRSRSGVWFRARPMLWGVTAAAEKEEDRRFAYLEVARRTDGPVGSPLASLQFGIDTVNARRESDVNAMRQAFHPDRSASWDELFALADRVRQPASRKDTDHRRQLSEMLRLSIEAAREALSDEVAYEKVRTGERKVELRAVDPLVNLAAIMARWAADDIRFEFASPLTAIGAGIIRVVEPDAFDADARLVVLDSDRSADLPETGVVRKASKSAETLYRRHRNILRQVEDDTYLLDVIRNPARFTRYTERLARDPLLELDGDKRQIAAQFTMVHPILAVQGPPGTGKTTLATELVLARLVDSPNGRILVTTHSHEPLDNLLERLHTEAQTNERARAALRAAEIIRIPSGWRPQSRESVQRHYPHARAEELFVRIRRWMVNERQSLGLAGKIAEALERRILGFESAPNSLRKRILDSANIVFTTINSREIHDALPSSYDLVIVEEAARLITIELLAAMRLARNWLLIGDHQQLPPYGHAELEQRFETALVEMADEIKTNPRRAAGEGLERVSALRDDFARFKLLFQHLHEFPPKNAKANHAATLQTQWRMHPNIAELVSEVFYQGKTVLNPPGPERDALAARRRHQFMAPEWVKDQQVIWIDFDHVDDDPATEEMRSYGGGIENHAERSTITELMRTFQGPRQTSDVAIITPYRQHAEQLRRVLDPGLHPVLPTFTHLQERVFTVDAFQGRQAGTVFLSLVRNNREDSPSRGVGFLTSPQRATVMFSRAERLLVILGCSAQFAKFEDQGTRWIMEIHRRANVKYWRDILQPGEYDKIVERRSKFKNKEATV